MWNDSLRVMCLIRVYSGRDFLVYKTLKLLYPELNESGVIKILNVLDFLNVKYCEDNIKEEYITVRYRDNELTGIYSEDGMCGNEVLLMTKKWSEWISFKIDIPSINSVLSPCEMLCRILYEMTLLGYEEDTINKQNDIYEFSKKYSQIKVKDESMKKVVKNSKLAKKAIYLREKNHHSFAIISEKTGLTEDEVKNIWWNHKYK